MDQPKKTAIFFLVFLALYVDVQAYKPEEQIYGSILRIDCGSLVNSTNDFDSWQRDEQFTKSGENKILSTNQTSPEMNTLRFFPNGKRNCYKAPFYDFFQNKKYLVRAGFYYGNYDGLNKPPSFSLEIDGIFWTNVTTSIDTPVYYEMLYMRKGLQTTVCLVRTEEHDDEVPFVSSIEAYIILGDLSYKMMNNKTAFHLISRINYGANQTVEKSISKYDEWSGRIWKSKEMPNYISVDDGSEQNGYATQENNPPWKVMNNAIQANTINESLYLPINMVSELPLQAYIILYFMDPIFSRLPNESCKVEVYVDDVKITNSDVPNGISGYERNYSVVSLFPVLVVGGSANLTICKAEGSTLAPMLNALEVYTAFDVSSSGGNLMIVNFLRVGFVVFSSIYLSLLLF